MSHEHPYPDYAYIERDPDTDEKRWFGTKGMGVCYVHEDRAAEYIEAAIQAERERCAKMVDDLRATWFHDGIPGDLAVPAGAFARSMKELAAVMRDPLVEVVHSSATKQ